VSQFRKLSQLLVKKTTYVWTYSAGTRVPHWDSATSTHER
jgi:hypothetical protein